MLATIEYGEFRRANDAKLVERCVQPILPFLPTRGAPLQRVIYGQLTYGQVVLACFWTLVGSVGETPQDLFVWAVQILKDPPKWSALKTTLQDLGMTDLFKVLEQIEEALRENEASLSNRDADLSFAFRFSQLSITLHSLLPSALTVMGDSIRSHRSEFFTLVFDDA